MPQLWAAFTISCKALTAIIYNGTLRFNIEARQETSYHDRKYNNAKPD